MWAQQAIRAISASLAGLAIVGLAASAAIAQVEVKQSKWGAEDEIGAANLITPASVLAAATLIRTGRTYHLGIPVDSTMPAYPPRTISLQVVQPGQQAGQVPFPNGGTYNDDILHAWLGVGSQIDGLGHVGINHVYYNQNHAKDFAMITGLTKLGIEKIPPIVARGVLLDMAAHFGVSTMDSGQKFTKADIQAVEASQGVEIREGDVVLFHTGWIDHVLPKDPTKWGSTAPGISQDGAEYLAGKNVVAVGADTWSLDVIPPEDAKNPYVSHLIFLIQNGIYILEVMNTGPLAKDKVGEFLFVLGVPRIKGAVQMMANPIAID
jgi:kynurenine formamidase